MSYYETSYLNVIERAPKGPTKSDTILRNARLETSDIDGARPQYPLKQFVNKPALHQTTDIDGTSPLKLIPSVVNKPNDRHLKNDDIEYSQPYQNRMRTSRRLNPLNPEYQLPSVEIKPPTPPKFLRETNQVDDINNDPDYPKRRIPSEIPTRDHMDYSDVVGDYKAVPKLKVRKSDHPTPLQVEDINNDMIFKTKRVTNPLSPRYVYDIPPSKKCSQKEDQNKNRENKSFQTNNQKSMTVSEWQIGEIPYNHPRKLPPMRQDRPLFSLHTEDIEEMKRTHNHHLSKYFPKERRQYREINRIEDIDSCHPSKKYTTFAKPSSRCINPLNPLYKF